MTRKQPPALYPLRRQRLEALARETGEAADIALGGAQIAKRAAESMPKPDPRENVNYKRLSGLEESFTLVRRCTAPKVLRQTGRGS